jgi:thiol:disulfide interchange protein
VFDAFGGPGMPTTVFIDAEGTVMEIIPGQLSAGLLRDHIRRNFGIG